MDTAVNTPGSMAECVLQAVYGVAVEEALIRVNVTGRLTFYGEEVEEDKH